jgi:hypothetical protein
MLNVFMDILKEEDGNTPSIQVYFQFFTLTYDLGNNRWFIGLMNVIIHQSIHIINST